MGKNKRKNPTKVRKNQGKHDHIRNIRDLLGNSPYSERVFLVYWWSDGLVCNDCQKSIGRIGKPENEILANIEQPGRVWHKICWNKTYSPKAL